MIKMAANMVKMANMNTIMRVKRIKMMRVIQKKSEIRTEI